MFNWLTPRAVRDENERLRQENLQLKASAESVIAESVSMPGQRPTSANLGNAKNQLEHATRGWQWTAISAIGKRVAERDLFVARRPRAPQGMRRKHVGNELEPLESHPMVDAIDDPNPLLVRWQALFLTTVSLLATGRAFWWITSDKETGKMQIWPLPANWVSPDNTALTAWRVRKPGDADGFSVRAEDMAFFSLPSPLNWTEGGSISPLSSQSKAVNVDEAIQASQEKTFQNSIHPKTAIVMGKNPAVPGQQAMRPVLTAEQRKQLLSAVKLAYSGTWNHGDPLILDGQVEDVKTFGQSEMDWIASGSQTKSRILQSFGVNALIVGEIEGANRAQAVVAERSFCTNTVNPLLTLLSQTLTAWVAPRFGDDIVCWFDPCQAEDDEQTLKRWSVALTKGVVSDNEFRRKILNIKDKPEEEDTGGGGSDNVQSTALNGAQIASMLQVAELVASGDLSTAAARAILAASFPLLPTEKLDAIVSALKADPSRQAAAEAYAKHLAGQMVDPYRMKAIDDGED